MKVRIRAEQIVFYDQIKDITQEEWESLQADDDQYEILASKYIDTTDVCDVRDIEDIEIYPIN